MSVKRSKIDRMHDHQQSSEEPAWVKAVYRTLCPCLMKNALNQETSTPKVMILQKRSPNGECQTVYDVNCETSDRNSSPRSSIQNNPNEGIVVDYQPSFSLRDRKGLLNKSTTLMANSRIQKMGVTTKRSLTVGATYSINGYLEQKIVPIGNSSGHFLCLIKTVRIEPSPLAQKKTQFAAQRDRKRGDYSNYLDKYWDQRYYLFQKFDQGVKMNQQSWLSEVPQAIAEHISSKVKCDSLLDGFPGSGSCSIKFANTCLKVMVSDSIEDKLEIVVTNSKIYGSENIQLIQQNFLTLKGVKPQVVFIAPPYNKEQFGPFETVNTEDFKPPLRHTLKKATQLSHNLIILLPPSVQIEAVLGQLCASFGHWKYSMNTCSIKIEKIFYMGKIKYLCLYVGLLVQDDIRLNDELQYIYSMLKQSEQENFRHKRIIRTLRQNYGMLNLFNFVVDCLQVGQNKNKMANFESYIQEHQLLSRDELQNLLLIEEREQIRQKKRTASDNIEQQKCTSGFDNKTERTDSEYSNCQGQMGFQRTSEIQSPKPSTTPKRNSSMVTIQIMRNDEQASQYSKKNTIDFEKLRESEPLKSSYSAKNLS